MRRRLLTVLAAIMISGGVSTAGAQQAFPLRVPAQGASVGEAGILVSVNYGLRLPLKSDQTQAQSEALESARRALYGIAASECKVLLETIAASCKLERLNVQSNVQSHSQTQQVHVGGNAAYRITLK